MALFVYFIWISDFKGLKGYEVALFLEINPLVGLSSLLTGWTVYKGLWLSLLVIIPTIFFGRFFCSWVCPMGIANHWAGHQARSEAEYIKVNSHRPLYRLKYYLLAVLLILSLFGASQIGLFDPIAMIYRSFIISVFPAIDSGRGFIFTRPHVFLGGVLISLLFIAVIFASRGIPRLFCRAICPLGAMLGVASLLSVMRIRRDIEKCTDCNLCLQSCQGACDPHTGLRASECLMCMNCITDCKDGALSYGLPKPSHAIHKPLDVNRRRLVETALASAILFPMMKTSLTSEANPQPMVIRPPGALSEPDFLRRCIKCSMCMRVCPTNVLQPALLEAGFEGLWSPILINKIGYCEYHCTLCGQVCPTGAIEQVEIKDKVGTRDVKPIKLGTAFYDRGRCLPWAMNTQCIVCEEVCPTSPKAIWFEEAQTRTRSGAVKKLKRPFVDPKLCIGCGICENKCPVRDWPAIRVTSVGETRSLTNRMILKR